MRRDVQLSAAESTQGVKRSADPASCGERKIIFHEERCMKQIATENVHPFLRVFNDEHVHEIHSATVEVLSKTGMVFKDEEAIGLLKKAGAHVEGEVVKIPEHILKRALSTAPSRVQVYDRAQETAMNLQRGKTYFGTGSDTIFTWDIHTKKRRKTVLEDIRNFARVTDALPNLDFVMSMGNPADVDPKNAYVYEFVEMLRGTTKPIVFTANDREDTAAIHRIAASAVGGDESFRQRPFILLYAEPISPKLFNRESVQKLLFCAEKGIPVAFVPSPNTGAGGPITVAGALALGNAESLTGLVLAQLKNPGAPFVFGSNIAALDMKSAVVSYGSPEWILGSAATVEMARFYNLPAWGTSGATDSKLLDAQAGMEAMLSVYNALLTRSQLVHDNGYLESGLTSSMEMIVLVDEAISISRYLLEGIAVDRNTLALDAIGRVTPGRGFLDDDHTMNNWREVQYHTERLDRRVFDNWEKTGSMDMYSRLNEEVKKILETHEPQELEDPIEKTFEAVLEERK
jgi:trimethylamine--corrinoid protein Co-methyltransferase